MKVRSLFRFNTMKFFITVAVLILLFSYSECKKQFMIILYQRLTELYHPLQEEWEDPFSHMKQFQRREFCQQINTSKIIMAGRRADNAVEGINNHYSLENLKFLNEFKQSYPVVKETDLYSYNAQTFGIRATAIACKLRKSMVYIAKLKNNNIYLLFEADSFPATIKLLAAAAPYFELRILERNVKKRIEILRNLLTKRPRNNVHWSATEASFFFRRTLTNFQLCASLVEYLSKSRSSKKEYFLLIEGKDSDQSVEMKFNIVAPKQYYPLPSVRSLKCAVIGIRSNRERFSLSDDLFSEYYIIPDFLDEKKFFVFDENSIQSPYYFYVDNL